MSDILSVFSSPTPFFPLNLLICPSLSVGQRWRGILIYIVMHQHFGCPGSIEVWQHLGQPVRVNRLADMTCPAPVIELLAICRPWLSCCHIIVNLGVTVVHHVLIGWDNGIHEHFVLIIGFLVSILSVPLCPMSTVHKRTTYIHQTPIKNDSVSLERALNLVTTPSPQFKCSWIQENMHIIFKQHVHPCVVTAAPRFQQINYRQCAACSNYCSGAPWTELQLAWVNK